jgi:hypothetical protein
MARAGATLFETRLRQTKEQAAKEKTTPKKDDEEGKVKAAVAEMNNNPDGGHSGQ